MLGRRQCCSFALVFSLLLTVAVAATVYRSSPQNAIRAKVNSRRSLNKRGTKRGTKTRAKHVQKETKSNFVAIDEDLRRSVSEAAIEVAAEKSPGHLISKEVEGVQSTSKNPECVVPAGLKMEEVEHAATELFGQDSFFLGSPACEGSVVTYPTMGRACSMPTGDLVTYYYEEGIRLMLLGATTEEAFAPFIHLRVLASNLVACHLSLNPRGIKAIPDSYAGLYDMYATRLVGRLRDSKRLRKAPDSQAFSLASKSLNKKLDAALSIPIFTPIEPDDMKYLPLEDELSAFSMPPISREFSKSVVRDTTGETTENECDAGFDAGWYFLYPLQVASNPDENCCSCACSAVLSVSRRFTTSMDTCCKDCNLHSCTPETEEMVKALAFAAVLYGVVKEDMTPRVYTFVV